MFWNKQQKKKPVLELYSPEEQEAVERYINNVFGASDNVFHELISPDIHVDINIIEPTGTRDYITLITTGMGAHRMSVPKQLKGAGLDRTELLITLPSDWKIHEEETRWYWPMGWLKQLARFPLTQNTWLGYGHTIQAGAPLAEDTSLCSFMLTTPLGIPDDTPLCTLPNGERVLFYQVIPLYEEEMNYATGNGAEALEERFPSGYHGVIDIGRPRFV